mgnify:CR=1 FL=1
MGHPTETQIMNKIIEIGDMLSDKISDVQSSLDSLDSSISWSCHFSGSPSSTESFNSDFIKSTSSSCSFHP